MALLRTDPTPASTPLATIRRCTFRRLTVVELRPSVTYGVECLYPDHATPLPLGDLDSAREVCEGCTALGTFRADED